MPGRVNYYVDEHIANAVVKGLRQRGVDVVTTADANMIGASDRQQLSFAKADGRALFTHDDDFLPFQGKRHPGP